MAIVKVGAPLAGIRGTLGGIVYSKNKAGPYAKQWSRPSNPRTPKQTVERGYLARMPALWTALTALQRAVWDWFAALAAQKLFNSLGEEYYISGYGWFCKCNIRLLRVGRATRAGVPTQARPAAPTIDDFRICAAGAESDLATGGVASASSFSIGFPASKAFDDSVLIADRWTTVAGATTGWLQYVMSAAHIIKRYRLYIHDHGATANPKSWTFEVKNNGGWNVIHTVTNFAPTAQGWDDFYCPNTIPTDTYRIDITLNNGNLNTLYLVEMEYYAADVGASVICYPEDEFDDAPDYDLILHVSQGQTIGKSVQYPGYYETLAIQDPGRWFALFQDELEAIFGTIQMERSWFAHLYRQTREGLRSAAQAANTVTIGG